MKTSESKKQFNTYAIYDCMGRLTDVRYYASNKAEAMKLFKADTVNYRKYGYFGKLSRIYNGVYTVHQDAFIKVNQQGESPVQYIKR